MTPATCTRAQLKSAVEYAIDQAMTRPTEGSRLSVAEAERILHATDAMPRVAVGAFRYFHDEGVACCPISAADLFDDRDGDELPWTFIRAFDRMMRQYLGAHTGAFSLKVLG